jgi:formylglycine-generating enzyme required for sulfatase activity
VSDLAGNVWEWCSTQYNSGSDDLNGTDVRVLRGGSWRFNDSQNFRAEFRDWNIPHGRNDDFGFRIARS